MTLDDHAKEFRQNAESKRSAILDGARKVFLTRGFDGSSMSEIARVAGVSKGTLYVYYADKKKLFEAIVEEEIRRQTESEFHFDTLREPEGVLREFGRYYVRALCRRGGGSTILTVMAIAERMPDIGRRYYEEVIERTARRLGLYLKSQVISGRLLQLNGDFAASQFVLMCQASLFQPFIFQALLTPTEAEISNVVDSATRLFLATYATASSKSPADEGARPPRLSDEFPSCVFPASVPPIHQTFGLPAKRSPGTEARLGISSRATEELNANLKGAHEPSIESVPVLAGFKAFVAEGEGRGYWDFFRVSSNLIISIADVRYYNDQRFDLPAEDILKVRILLRGRLLDSDKRPTLQGPNGVFCLHNETNRSTYYIAGGIETKLIVLHCRADLLQELFGIRQVNAADPFQLMFNSDRMRSPKSFKINHSLYRAVSDIVASRMHVFEPLRRSYVRAKAIEIVGLVIQDLYSNQGEREMTASLSATDLIRISEAQGILLANFVSPPTIKRLARLVGINQTKLKSGFKAVQGETIFDFVRRHRMERAAELLLSSSYDVSTAAYEVGYSYSANFTNAFRRYFGYTPSELKARGRSNTSTKLLP